MMSAAVLAICGLSSATPCQSPVRTPGYPVVFMVPVAGMESGDSLETFAIVDDSARVGTLLGWLDNPPARWALDLYDRARAVAIARDSAAAHRQPAAYYVALVPGGNHGDLGFRLRTEAGIEEHPRTAFIRLGPDEWRFSTTFLHETGHVVTHVLAGGRRFDARPMAAIPHSTAALTDRQTAFHEGFAIHLETFAARLDTSTSSRNRYDHWQMPFGRVEQAPRVSEYYHALVDLLSFSQNVARYRQVADNAFAFRSAFTGADYLRVQLERARDFAELRNADQMLQSEGFYASFFYSILFRGIRPPGPDTIRQRQNHLLEVLADVLDAPDAASNRPWLTDIVRAWQVRYPAEFPEILDVFLDLSHGEFVDDAARATWKSAYLAGLRLDMPALNLDVLETRRQSWRDRVLADPATLDRRIGPELPCSVPSVRIKLAELSDQPLQFDLNTVQEGVLRLVPGLTEVERSRWLAQRDRTPFTGYADFERRVDLGRGSRSALRFVRTP